MSSSILSPNWHRVAPLRLRLRRHVTILRRQHRDGLHYLLQDDMTGQFHRFSPASWEVIGRLDGRHTIEEIWDAVCARLGEKMPKQQQIIDLISQLQNADLVQGDRSPDVASLVRRGSRDRRRQRFRKLASPLSVYLPLFDPERVLEATRGGGRLLFSRLGLVVWLLAVLSGFLVLGLNWAALTHGLADRVFAAENLLLMAAAYPATKAVHEFGHALAVKRWGGQVHEMGIVLIVFFPVPYVDASAASAFPLRRQRAIVGAAGMMFDLLIAAVACWVWVLSEQGLVRALAMNVVMLAGVSTLVFNGNPLLRFDAYYILSDLLRVPNLGARANAQVGYWLCRAAGVREFPTPVTSYSEGLLLGGYSLLSFAYRLVVIVSLSILLASHFSVLGVVLAIWSLGLAYVWPTAKLLVLPMRDARLQNSRWRIYGLPLVLLLTLLTALFAVPLPYGTRAQGIVWADEDSVIRATSPGFVERVVASPHTRVLAGDPLLVLADPELDARVALTRADLRRAELEYQAVLEDPNLALAYRDSLRFLSGQLEREKARRQGLLVTSPRDGLFQIAKPDELTGSYVRRGELLGFVTDGTRMHVTVVLPEEAVALVRDRTARIELRLASAPEHVVEARLLRQVPAATHELPSRVLALEGGGPFALDPRQQGASSHAFQRLFRLDLAVPGLDGHRLEERAYVLFVHAPEPVAYRLYRWIRTNFLRQFNV